MMCSLKQVAHELAEAIGFHSTLQFRLQSIEATDAEITLKAFSKTYVFLKASITDIWLNAALFSTGVQIEHCVDKYPKYVVFWTTNVDEFRSNLHRLDYKTR